MLLIINLFKVQFRQLLSSRHKWIVLVFIIISLQGIVFPIRRACDAMGLNITPWIFPFFTKTMGNRILVLIGAVLLFMNAPFIHPSTWLRVIRADKRRWMVSNFVYMMVTAILYTLSFHLLLLVGMVGSLTWQNAWGKAIVTMARNDQITKDFTILLSFDQALMDLYEPIPAMIHASLLMIIQVFIIGLIILTISLFFKGNQWGIIGALTYISSEVFNHIFGYVTFRKYFPAGYMDLTMYGVIRDGWNPPLIWGYGVLMGIAVVLMTISMIKIRKKDFDIYPVMG